MSDPYIAFDEQRRIASGSLHDVALAVRAHTAAHPAGLPIIFDAESGRPIDVHLSGSDDDVCAWIDAHYPAPAKRGRGRPKLGVVSKEVTLLPRQWQWLADQPGGASVTLRRLVDAAAKNPEAERRGARDAVYRFTTALAGDAPGFEEAMRALYAGDQPGFEAQTAAWPEDVRHHALTLAEPTW